ncbi:MAG: hypothetical protein ABI823_15345 [Bryobacteraceae bacterium]
MPAEAQLIALAAVAVLLIAIGIWVLLRVKNNPERKERRRRIHVNGLGRLGDATITEVSADSIFYSYSIGGVAYTASQDIGALHAHLPADHERLIGHAFMKYAPRNPANSIIVCEEWSGIRAPSPRSEPNTGQEISEQTAAP